jgi:hypothetical protein
MALREAERRLAGGARVLRPRARGDEMAHRDGVVVGGGQVQRAKEAERSDA